MAVNLDNFEEKMRNARLAIPALWREPEVGLLQFDFLISNGLRPEHKLLDIGCGPIRAGIHFIDYLNDGNYYGIDCRSEYYIIGYKIAELLNVNKTWNFFTSKVFYCAVWGVKFDYILAASLFTHLSEDDILLCLQSVKKVMKGDGMFFATFFEKEDNPPKISDGLFRHGFNIMMKLAKKAEISIEFIGRFGHPNIRQLMLKFEWEK